MKINDLRIGNLLQTRKKEINNTKIGNNIVIVRKVEAGDIEAEDVTENDKYGLIFRMDDCEPIKLSELIIQSCGFEKQDVWKEYKNISKLVVVFLWFGSKYYFINLALRI